MRSIWKNSRLYVENRVEQKEEERERDPPELHQRTLGCTPLTSTCVNNSLLFLSFLLLRFRSPVSLLRRNNYDPLPWCSFSKFHPFHLLLLSTKLYLTFHRCPNFPSSRLKILPINLTFFFSTSQFRGKKFFPSPRIISLSLSLSVESPNSFHRLENFLFHTDDTLFLQHNGRNKFARGASRGERYNFRSMHTADERNGIKEIQSRAV